MSCGAGGEYDHETVWEDGPLYARCQGGNKFEVWTDQTGDEIVELESRDFACRAQPADSNEVVGKMVNMVYVFLTSLCEITGTCGPENKGTEIVLGFDTKPSHPGTETMVLTVCYDTDTSVNIWSRHSLWDEINARDHNNDSPFFNPDDYFDFDVNHYYTMVSSSIIKLNC